MSLPDRIRKILGPLLTVLLLGGVAVGIWLSAKEKLTSGQTVEVKGLSGSEKLPFLSDPRVLAHLEKQGIRLTVQKAGSREIALRPDLKQFDFAYPAGVSAATKIQREQGTRATITTFFTPMVVASWRPVVTVLEAHGIVQKRGGNWYIKDMMKLLQWMEEGRRWRDIPGNTQYPVGKSVLISTTDLRTSNSAAMYLALVSYLANGRDVVQEDAQMQRVMPLISNLFLKQGYQESSTSGPFDDYMSMGMGKAPMVMIYESQFIEYQTKTPPAARNPDMVLLYPEPTVYTKHVLVPLNDKGRRLGEQLANDPVLQRFAVEYGYRVSNPTLFREMNAQRGIQAPESLLDVIDPPAYEMLEKMINTLEARMRQ